MLDQSTLKFLKALARNNNKPWFDKHRVDYDAARLDFETFIQNVINQHGKKDPDIAGLSAKQCLYRINRDIRFTKDKTPYKRNFAASMDKGGKKSGLAGYYIQIEPGRSFIGGGIWQPTPERTKKIRQEIDYCFDEFSKVVQSKKFRSLYPELYAGEDVRLTKLPHGFEKDNPAAIYLKFKSWLVITDLKDEDVTSKNLLNKTLKTLETTQPFIEFLNRAVEE